MKIDVYDSYAQTSKGIMHFDVFVESGTSSEQAFKFGRLWLSSIGENEGSLDQSHCNFCHSKIAKPEVKQQIAEYGYYIFTMEGCPRSISH